VTARELRRSSRRHGAARPEAAMKPRRSSSECCHIIGLPMLLVWSLSSPSPFWIGQRQHRLSGKPRSYLLYCPPELRPRQADAARHQHARRRGMAGQQMNLSGWNRLAESQGSSSSTRRKRCAEDLARGPRGWSRPGCRIHLGADRHTRGGLQHRPDADLCQWLSAGGGMAFVLSCTLSDRIAAVGLVAAAQPMDWGWCQTSDRFR